MDPITTAFLLTLLFILLCVGIYVSIGLLIHATATMWLRYSTGTSEWLQGEKPLWAVAWPVMLVLKPLVLGGGTLITHLKGYLPTVVVLRYGDSNRVVTKDLNNFFEARFGEISVSNKARLLQHHITRDDVTNYLETSGWKKISYSGEPDYCDRYTKIVMRKDTIELE